MPTGSDNRAAHWPLSHNERAWRALAVADYVAISIASWAPLGGYSGPAQFLRKLRSRGQDPRRNDGTWPSRFGLAKQAVSHTGRTGSAGAKRRVLDQLSRSAADGTRFVTRQTIQ